MLSTDKFFGKIVKFTLQVTKENLYKSLFMYCKMSKMLNELLFVNHMKSDLHEFVFYMTFAFNLTFPQVDILPFH